MIERAVANAASAGVQADFQVAGFGELAGLFSGYDALLCLGNSLPHVLDLSQLAKALADFAACLRPGGLLLVQQRNFDAVLAQRAPLDEVRASGAHRRAGVAVRALL